MLSTYPACFFHDNDGYSVIFPDLNYLATCGQSLDEAMTMAIDCLAGYLYSCKLDNTPIPEPSPISDISPTNIAAELETDCGDVFTSLVSVDVEDYAKKHFEKSIKKTLTIPAWLNAAAIKQGINFSQVLQEALILKLKNKG